MEQLVRAIGPGEDDGAVSHDIESAPPRTRMNVDNHSLDALSLMVTGGCCTSRVPFPVPKAKHAMP